MTDLEARLRWLHAQVRSYREIASCAYELLGSRARRPRTIRYLMNLEAEIGSLVAATRLRRNER